MRFSLSPALGRRFLLLGALAASGAAALLAPTMVAPQTTEAVAAPAPKIYAVSPQRLRQVIARNKGKVVLVNFWATWCSPCLEELPAFARFARANKKDVVVLLVSADTPSDKAAVQKQLSQRGHSSTLQLTGDIPSFIEKFDPKLKGAVALPITYVFDKKGRQAEVVREETLKDADLKKLVAKYR